MSGLKGFVRDLVPGRVEHLLRKAYYRHQIRYQSPEPDAIACREQIRPGDVVLDIGANLGDYCKVLAQAGAVVHALEPIPETFGYLVSNMEALHLNNVFCYNIAASDRNGMARMTIPSWDGGGRNLYEAHLSDDGQIEVRTMRLDDLFPDLSPKLIKCDAEGHELQVINGARGLIRRCRPTWLIEITSKATVAEMMKLGYEVGETKGPNVFFSVSLPEPLN
jgi:FkbM family methyltransferase